MRIDPEMINYLRERLGLVGQAMIGEQVRQRTREEAIIDAIRKAEEEAKIKQKYRSPYETAKEQADLAKILQDIQEGQVKASREEEERWAFGLGEEIPETLLGRLPRTYTDIMGKELTLPPGTTFGTEAEGIVPIMREGKEVGKVTPKIVGKFLPKPKEAEALRGRLKSAITEKATAGKIKYPITDKDWEKALTLAKFQLSKNIEFGTLEQEEQENLIVDTALRLYEKIKGRSSVIAPKPTPEGYTPEQEQLIQDNMKAYNRPREEVIQALKKKGLL